MVWGINNKLNRLVSKLVNFYGDIRYWTEVDRSSEASHYSLFFFLSIIGIFVLVFVTLVNFYGEPYFLSCNLTVPEKNWLIASNQTILKNTPDCNELYYKLKEGTFLLELGGLFLVLFGIMAQSNLVKDQILNNYRVKHGNDNNKFANRNKDRKSPL